jgi:hypothetical protein
MGKQTINVGTTANDGTGSTIRAGGQIINNNFDDIYTVFGDGSTLSFTLSGVTNGQVLVYNSSTGKFEPGTASATSTFTIAGDGGSNQSITTGDTLTIQGGAGITTTGVNTDILSVAIDATVATLTGSQVLTGKTIAAGSNTISGLTNSNLSGSAGITNANLANSSITVVDDSSTSATISLGETLKISGDTGITTAISGDSISIDLDDTAVTPNTYGSSTAIPVVTVDQQGRLTNVTTAALSTDLTIVDDSSTSATISLLGDTLGVLGGSGITTTISGDNISIARDTLSYSKGTATGDGSTVLFTINSGRSVDDILVFVNGICLVPTDDYTISGTDLTFQTAPVASAEITFRYLPL